MSQGALAPIFLCPGKLDDDKDSEAARKKVKFALKENGKVGTEFEIPVGDNDWIVGDHRPDGSSMCLRSRVLPAQNVRGCQCRCLELLPPLIVHNSSDYEVEVAFFGKEQDVTKVPPGGKIAPSCSQNSQLLFRLASQDELWSLPFPAVCQSFGAAPFALRHSKGSVRRTPSTPVLDPWVQ